MNDIKGFTMTKKAQKVWDYHQSVKESLMDQFMKENPMCTKDEMTERFDGWVTTKSK